MGSPLRAMEQALLIGWTTVGSEAAAEQLAQALVEAGLAACVQIEAGLVSHYQWEGKHCRESEWRLTVKFAAAKGEALEAYLMEAHPYETPEWVVLRAEAVAPAYLRWALGE